MSYMQSKKTKNNQKEEKGLVVLSLFNGMNTGRQALENVGIPVKKYYSSEIKPYAIQLTQHHFPDTIQLGDIRNAHEWDIEWSQIDLVLSGSPCQDLSIAGKRKGLKGKNSSLFWLFIEILHKIENLNPNVLFFQENVASAPKEDVDIISKALGVEPFFMCSSRLTAQLRKRFYWSNIRTKKTGLFGTLKTHFPLPKDKGIMFKDILDSGFVDLHKARSVLQSEDRPYKDMEKFYRRYQTTGMNNAVFEFVDRDKAKTLLESEAKTYGYKCMEKFTGLINRRIAAGKQLPNLVFQINPSKESGGKQPYQHNRVYADYGKVTTLTESCSSRIKVAYEDLEKQGITVRILSKKELCRLQGFPDDYCDILSRNKAASLLGDGWTLPVIEHFFKFLKS